MAKSARQPAQCVPEGDHAGRDRLPALVKVECQEDPLFYFMKDGSCYVQIRSVCDALGLDLEAELASIAGDFLLKGVVIVTPVLSLAGDNEMGVITTQAIPLDYLNLWLVKIRPEEGGGGQGGRLILYREGCAQTIADHAFGEGAREIDTAATTPPPNARRPGNEGGVEDTALRPRRAPSGPLPGTAEILRGLRAGYDTSASCLENIVRWRDITKALKQLHPILFQARYAGVVHALENRIGKATDGVIRLIDERKLTMAHFGQLGDELEELLEATRRHMAEGNAIGAYHCLDCVTEALDRHLAEREAWEEDFLSRFAEADAEAQEVVRGAYRELAKIELTRDETTESSTNAPLIAPAPKTVH